METLEQTKNVITKRFDRHAEMNSLKRNEIMDMLKHIDYVEDEDEKYFQGLKNYLYGLFDGYFYETYLQQFVTVLKERGYKGLSIRLGYIITDVSKYNFSS